MTEFVNANAIVAKFNAQYKPYVLPFQFDRKNKEVKEPAAEVRFVVTVKKRLVTDHGT